MLVQHLANLTNWNVNTIRWESRNITTQPGEIDDRKSKAISFEVNADMNITANHFHISIKERSFFVWSICFYKLKNRWKGIFKAMRIHVQVE